MPGTLLKSSKNILEIYPEHLGYGQQVPKVPNEVPGTEGRFPRGPQKARTVGTRSYVHPASSHLVIDKETGI